MDNFFVRDNNSKILSTMPARLYSKRKNVNLRLNKTLEMNKLTSNVERNDLFISYVRNPQHRLTLSWPTIALLLDVLFSTKSLGILVKENFRDFF